MANPIDIVIRTLATGNGIEQSERGLTRLARGAARSASDIATALSGVDPALSKVAGGLNDVLTGFAFGGGIGAGLTVVTTGVSALITTLMTAPPEVKKLNDELTSLANKGQTAETLARLAGVTEDQAEKALIAAGASREYARELLGLQEAASKTKGQQWLEQANELGIALTGWLPGMQAARDFGKEWNTVTEETTDAQDRLREKILGNTDAIIQHKGVIDKLPGALSAARSELDNYREAIDALGDTHAKNEARFAKDALKIDVNIGDQRAKIEEQLIESIGELEERQLGQRTEAYYRYQKSVIDVQAQIEDRARQSAQEQVDIYRQLQATLQNLDRDFGIQIGEAKTEREAARLQRDLSNQRTDERNRANEQSRGISQQLDDFMRASETRRATIDEEYRHISSLREQDDAAAIEKLQRQAARQRDELNQRRENEIAALRERTQEEDAAYAESLAKAQVTHTKRMKQITDLRSEQEKMAENMKVVGESGWTGWITGADKYKQKLVEILQLQDYLGRIASGKEKVAYASNLTYDDIIALMKSGQWQ